MESEELEFDCPAGTIHKFSATIEMRTERPITIIKAQEEWLRISERNAAAARVLVRHTELRDEWDTESASGGRTR